MINLLCGLPFQVCPLPLCYLSTFFCFQQANCIVCLFLQLENQSTKTSEFKSAKSLRGLLCFFCGWSSECFPCSYERNILYMEQQWEQHFLLWASLFPRHEGSHSFLIPEKVSWGFWSSQLKNTTNTKTIKSKHFLNGVLPFPLPLIPLRFKGTLYLCINIHFELPSHFVLSAVSLQSLLVASLPSLPPLIRETIFSVSALLLASKRTMLFTLKSIS